jgi:hypothetical protein
MPMSSARNMDVIFIGHVISVLMKNLVLEAKSESHGRASRRSLRHKVQGARHKEKISFVLLFLPCTLCLKP